MTGASCALRTAPIVYRRPEPYNDMDMTRTSVDVRLAGQRKHVELLTAARYLHRRHYIDIIDQCLPCFR